MEIDSKLLEKLKKDNFEFKRLYEEHTRLKDRVEELNRLKFLTADQEVEKKTIQKQKLISKDKLDKIISQHHATLH